MSNPPSAEEVAVVSAIRQSMESDGGPGCSVNHTNNPFVVGLVGQFDLLKMAERVVRAVDNYRTNVAALNAKLEAERAAKLAAEPAPVVQGE